MKPNTLLPRFPFDLYTQVGQKIQQQKKTAALQKEKWQTIRTTLKEKEQTRLDNEFKKTFEQFQNFFYLIASDINPESVLADLQKLVSQGASAKLLDNYELGKFNLATAIRFTIDLHEEKDLLLAEEIICTTALVEADMVKQKAYAGNGGAPALYWLCEYLAQELDTGTFRVNNVFQYRIFFRLFCFIYACAPETLKAENYWMTYQYYIRPSDSEEVASLQQEVLLWIIHSHPTNTEDLWLYRQPFYCIPALIKNNQEDWIPLFYPFPDPRIQAYLDFLQTCLRPEAHGKWLNGFKVTKQGRKFFQNYFSKEPHWLLSYTLQHCSESIGKLVQGQEMEMLEPFLKNYKTDMLALRDKKGNSLLHLAVQGGNPTEKMIVRLLKAGFSAGTKNDVGETSVDIAWKKNRKELVEVIRKNG
jgi:hypothetical protein